MLAGHLPRVLSELVRVRSACAMDMEAASLGLVIAGDLAEHQGGEMEVRCSVSEGSAFLGRLLEVVGGHQEG